MLFKQNYVFSSSTQTRLTRWLRIRTRESQAGESGRSRVKARCAGGTRPWAGRWLVWRSPRRLGSAEGLAEGVLGNCVHRTEAGSWPRGAAEVREGSGEGGVREGRRIRAGCPSVPTAGLVLIKQNRFVS